MKLDDILATINNVSYENVEEVVIPTKDLVDLRRAILNLQESLRLEKVAHRKTQSEAMGILANQYLVERFEDYA